MHAAYTVPVRSVQHITPRRKTAASTWLMLGGLAVTALISLGVVGVTLGALLIRTVSSPPPVTALGLNLGGLSADQAAAQLAAWNTLQVRDGERVWSMAAADLGLQVDSRATAIRVQQAAADQHGTHSLIQVTPVITVDLGRAQKGLDSLADHVARPAANATIRYVNGQLTPVAAVEGRTLNVAATLEKLRIDTGSALADGALDLVMNRIAPSVTDATPLLAKAGQLLAAPLTISAYNPITNTSANWSVPSAQWGQWLSVDSQGAALKFSLDTAPLTQYLTAQNKTLSAAQHIDLAQSVSAIQAAIGASSTSVSVRVFNAPTTYTVGAGDTLGAIAWSVGVPMWRISKANPGLNTDALSAGQRITIPSKDDLLPLPIVYGKRIVVSISKQHMWVYENGALKWDWVSSTGIPDSPTMPGTFQVQTHDKNAYGALWDLWMPHFMGIYEAVPGFMNGIHGLPTLSSGRLLWGGVLGRPITYGCVLLSLENGAALYDWAQNGVVVDIQR